MDFIKKGFDSFELKILALIFMTFDHVAYFMTGIIEIPSWFNIIGRIAAPIFIFMVANGYYYTKSKTGYMKRLYLWSVFMSIANSLANSYIPHPKGAMVINNIFATMFYIVFFLYFIDKLKSGIKEKNKKNIIVPILLFIMVIVLQIGMFSILMNPTLEVSRIALMVAMIFLPTPLMVEGSIIFIILGLGFYYCLNSKKKTAIFYLALCILYFVVAVLPAGLTIENLFLINEQWLMILALPFILLYNRQKGRGMKYLFYIYYPAHVYGLLLLSRVIYGMVK
ncbi:TraX family protein [Clostridium uliginosum]|uniref:TraX protein n=1 Tax=Clostridium uliginosum TaxID=119641 RepID=A0A1I1PWU8_9CLOT|nr:TraX family protein [Clostridium uliginosum]SFD14354.1 TraX protein [Clostridium uliginosum]